MEADEPAVRFDSPTAAFEAVEKWIETVFKRRGIGVGLQRRIRVLRHRPEDNGQTFIGMEDGQPVAAGVVIRTKDGSWTALVTEEQVSRLQWD